MQRLATGGEYDQPRTCCEERGDIGGSGENPFAIIEHEEQLLGREEVRKRLK
jgi:hypothetical protein